MVIITFSLGSLIHRCFDWIRSVEWRDVLIMSIALVLLAMVIEFVAVDRPALWHYSRLMPLVPVIEVGLLPTIQLASLTVLTFTLGGWMIRQWGALD